MKQITYFLLLLSLIGYISTAETCEDMTSKDACRSHELTEADKNAENEVCCYTEVSGVFGGCYGYTKEEAEQMKKTYKVAKVTFKCSSNWLKLGFSLALLVLFF